MDPVVSPANPTLNLDEIASQRDEETLTRVYPFGKWTEREIRSFRDYQVSTFIEEIVVKAITKVFAEDRRSEREGRMRKKVEGQVRIAIQEALFQESGKIMEAAKCKPSADEFARLRAKVRSDVRAQLAEELRASRAYLRKAQKEEAAIQRRLISSLGKLVPAEDIECPETISRISGLLPVKDLVRACGIYFLCSGGEVTYVGQSVDIRSRVLNHYSTMEIQKTHGAEEPLDFTSVFAVLYPPDRLGEVEGAFIRLLRPRCNKSNGRQVSELVMDEIRHVLNSREVKDGSPSG